MTKKANQLQKQFQIIFLSTKHAFISDLLYISPQRKIGCCLFGQLAQQSQMGGGRKSGDFKSKHSQKTHKPKQCLEKDKSSNDIRNKPEPQGHCPISLFLSSSLREIKEPDWIVLESSFTKDYGSYNKLYCPSGIYHHDQHPHWELTQDTLSIFSEVLMQSAQSGDL